MHLIIRLQFICSALLLTLSASGQIAPSNRPNILWLTSEDNSTRWIGCYGNPEAETPHIDQLAAEGFQYMHAYANAPVCAPSRSTWITGIHALSMGTHPMRSRYDIPHDQIAYYPDQLKANGYHVGNLKKTDYNIGGRPDEDCWDSTKPVKWDQLKNQQPFFQVINLAESHESRAFGDVYQAKGDTNSVNLRAYHPDVPGMRENYLHYRNAVKKMDNHLGAFLEQLEAAGLNENTIVIYNSDHGGVLPRSKRFLFEGSLHCPLILRIPGKYKALWPAENPGEQVDRLTSFIDMPKTWLSITGSEIPTTMQGTTFLGPNSEPEQEFHFAFRGRMDERIDNARAVSNKRYLYIRNYMPYVPWLQRLDYLWKMEATKVWLAYAEAGKTSEVESRFFLPKKWTEELYDMEQDPDCVVNLIDSPEQEPMLKKMRIALRTWQTEIHDSGLLPESEMVRLAKTFGKTIYEIVRDPKLYNLPALLDAADLALEENPDHAAKLHKLTQSNDLGLRYWGAIGLFLINDASNSEALLKDESHEVRAMAAWNLIGNGDKTKGLANLRELIDEDSYATLTVLNIADWLGDEASALLASIRSKKKYIKYEERMQAYLLKE